MSSVTFVEWAGKKEYNCQRCGAKIKFAKFFGPNGQLMTTDGEEPYFDMSRKPVSNTGFPTNPLTKEMHECRQSRHEMSTHQVIVADKPTEPRPKTPAPTEELEPDLDLSSLKWIDNHITLIKGIEKRVKEKLGNVADAKIGMYVKIIFDEMSKK